MDKKSDLELTQQIKQFNCEDSLRELITRHEKLVFKTLNKFKIKELYDEKDIIIYRAAIAFNPEKGAKFSTWLANQTRYVCLNYLNKKTPDFPIEPETIEEAVFDDYSSCDANYILGILKNLDDKRYEKIFKMKYYNGYNWTKIAKEMGISSEWVIRLHERGKNILKNKLTAAKHEIMMGG